MPLSNLEELSAVTICPHCERMFNGVAMSMKCPKCNKGVSITTVFELLQDLKNDDSSYLMDTGEEQ